MKKLVIVSFQYRDKHGRISLLECLWNDPGRPEAGDDKLPAVELSCKL